MAPRLSLKQRVKEVERQILLQALLESGWDLGRAADQFKVRRGTMQQRLWRRGISAERGYKAAERGASPGQQMAAACKESLPATERVTLWVVRLRRGRPEYLGVTEPAYA